jgi:DNA-binding NarL/FixJ family response regulator
MSAARVLVVEDHPLYRRALAQLVTDMDWALTGAVGSAEEALEEIGSADVVLLDLGLPGMDGLTALRHLRGRNPAVAVLVLTMTDDPGVLSAAVRAGAAGYLVKGSEPEDIERALRGVAGGQAVFTGDLATAALAGARGPAETARRRFPSLTDRELEVLDLVAAGCGNQQIAATLVLSEKTARNHVSNILTKLGLTRLQAVAAARDAGLGHGVAPRPPG